MHKLQLEKQKTKMWAAREILWKDHWWIYISFEILIIDLVGVEFKFTKFGCMLHVLLKHLLLLYVKKLIRTNKLFLSIET